MTDTLNGTVKTVRNGHAHPDERNCPTCGSVIPLTIYAAILGRQNAHDVEIEKKAEQAITAKFTRQLAEAQKTKRAEIAAAVKVAARAAEAKLAAIRANQAGAVSAAVEAERAKAGKAVVDAVNVEKARHFDEKLRLEAQLADMQRKLAAQPAHQIGEPAEVDLYDALMAAFPADQISRVAKGVKGPDVVMDVVTPSGEIAGRVILDSKAHARWSNRFTTKLRSDQLTAKADFAILVSSAFPAGARELHLQDGVLVVSPSRAVVVVQFLRQQIVANHRLKLSGEARDEKGDRLLAFMTSAAASDHFDRLAKATDDMIDLEAREIDMQTGIHRKRGEMIRVVQRVQEELVAEIERIIAGNSPIEIEALT